MTRDEKALEDKLNSMPLEESLRWLDANAVKVTVKERKVKPN